MYGSGCWTWRTVGKMDLKHSNELSQKFACSLLNFLGTEVVERKGN